VLSVKDSEFTDPCKEPKTREILLSKKKRLEKFYIVRRVHTSIKKRTIVKNDLDLGIVNII